MGEMSFNEEDKQKFVEFLNLIAENAEFKFKTKDVITYFKLLAHMQSKVLPKIEANILEVKQVIEAPKESTKETKSKSK